MANGQNRYGSFASAGMGRPSAYAKPGEDWYQEMRDTGTLQGIAPPSAPKARDDHGGPLQMQRGQSSTAAQPPSYTAPAWGGVVPTPTFTGGSGDTGAQPAPDWSQLAGATSFDEWQKKWSGWQDSAGNYFATQLPIQQFLQNQYQYGQDFGESARRWDEQMRWQQQLDNYNAMLAGRQQQLAEGQTQSAADQWAQQFQYQRGLDQRSMDLERELQSLNAFGRSVTPGARFVRNWG